MIITFEGDQFDTNNFGDAASNLVLEYTKILDVLAQQCVAITGKSWLEEVEMAKIEALANVLNTRMREVIAYDLKFKLREHSGL